MMTNLAISHFKSPVLRQIGYSYIDKGQGHLHAFNNIHCTNRVVGYHTQVEAFRQTHTRTHRCCVIRLRIRLRPLDKQTHTRTHRCCVIRLRIRLRPLDKQTHTRTHRCCVIRLRIRLRPLDKQTVSTPNHWASVSKQIHNLILNNQKVVSNFLQCVRQTNN